MQLLLGACCFRGEVWAAMAGLHGLWFFWALQVSGVYACMRVGVGGGRGEAHDEHPFFRMFPALAL